MLVKGKILKAESQTTKSGKAKGRIKIHEVFKNGDMDFAYVTVWGGLNGYKQGDGVEIECKLNIQKNAQGTFVDLVAVQ